MYFNLAGVLKNKFSTKIFVPRGLETTSCFSMFPPLATSNVPCFPCSVAVFIVIKLIEAIDGRASPRKPKVRIRKRSLWLLILDVA